MQRLFMKLYGVILLVLLGACASPPTDIPAAYVPMKTYADLNCQQIETKLESNAVEIGKLQFILQDKANVDASQMGIGIFFFPTLLFLEGGDGEEAKRYARLKGERRALAGQVAQKNCPINLNDTDMTLTDEVCRPIPDSNLMECIPIIGRRVP
jgi:hypothetical protein